MNSAELSYRLGGLPDVKDQKKLRDLLATVRKAEN